MSRRYSGGYTGPTSRSNARLHRRSSAAFAPPRSPSAPSQPRFGEGPSGKMRAVTGGRRPGAAHSGIGGPLKRILTDRQQELLTEARHQLEGVLAVLARFEASRDDQELLRRSLRQLDELFLLVVAGEFNSGKSTFINALLGKPLLEEGVTPTTTRIHTLTFGEQEERQVGENGIERIEAPVEMLKQVQIVDTPGTNALDRQHELITQSFIPRSDLVLFVTSADRPFTESERAFIEQIRSWGKKLVFIVNKIDILSGDAAVAEIEAFITENTQRLLGFSPEIFAVSSRQALMAKTSSDGGTPPPESRFVELERYLVDTLDEKERVRLKLLNPVGVGVNLVEKY